MLKKLLFLIAVAFAVSSCGKKVDEATLSHIPGESAIVMALNTKNLLQKADYQWLKGTEMYKDLVAAVQKDSASAASAKYLDNINETGIDTERSAYAFFAVLDASFDNPSGGMVVPIKDQAKFTQFLNDTWVNENQYLKQDGEYTLLMNRGYEPEAEGNPVGIFNKEVFIAAGYNYEQKKTFLVDLMKQPKDKSILKEKSLITALGENHDVTLWLNSNSAAKAAQAIPTVAGGLGSVGLSVDMLPDNTIIASYDFKEGEVVAAGDWTINPKLKEVLDPFFRDEVKSDFNKFFPKENLAGVMTFGCNPTKILDFINKGAGAIALASMSEQTGMSSSELFGVLEGEIAVGLYPNAETKGSDVVAVAKVGNKSYLDKLLGTLKMSSPAFQQEGNVLVYTTQTYRPMSATEQAEYDRKVQEAIDKGNYDAFPTLPSVEQKVRLFEKDGFFVISSKQNVSDKILAGGYADAEQIEGSVWADIKKHVWGYYAAPGGSNFQMDLLMSQFNIPDSEKSKITSLFVGGNAQVDRKSSKASSLLSDKGRNSLRVILETVNQVYPFIKKSQQDQEAPIQEPAVQ